MMILKTNLLPKYILLVIFLCSNLFSKAQSKPLAVKSYTVEFKIKNAKINVSGIFGGLKSTINFDPLNPLNGSFEGTIDVNTLKTGIDMRDKHLKKTEYFDVVKYPQITLKSLSITKVKDNQYNAKCNLTMKGKTKEVMLPFTITTSNGVSELNGSLTLNRLDFGVGSSSVIMSNNLLVNINAIISK